MQLEQWTQTLLILLPYEVLVWTHINSNFLFCKIQWTSPLRQAAARRNGDSQEKNYNPSQIYIFYLILGTLVTVV